jgi:4-diphosphocytidyl-2-C-methyl-D-erythritol kinase
VGVEAVSLEAHAKVNLGLAVLGKRPDGFHEIDTVFQTVSLSDSLTLEPLARSEIVLETSGFDVPHGPGNLVWRAARCLIESAGAGGVSIRLTKRIPAGAGLGGGSADAAAVIAGMDRLFDLRLSSDEQSRLALTIGSDVPFMLRGGTARGRGRGEILDDLPPLKGVWLVIVTPSFQVSAREAYDRARIGLTRGGGFIKLICNAIRLADLEGLEEALHNDLEGGVVALYPEVQRIADALRENGANAVAMCGSGPTVLGITRRKEDANALATGVSRQGWSVRAVEPVEAGCCILT